MDSIANYQNGKVMGVNFGKEGNQVSYNDLGKLDLDQDCIFTFHNHQHLFGIDMLFLYKMESWFNRVLHFFKKDNLSRKVSMTIS